VVALMASGRIIKYAISTRKVRARRLPGTLRASLPACMPACIQAHGPAQQAHAASMQHFACRHGSAVLC